MAVPFASRRSRRSTLEVGDTCQHATHSAGAPSSTAWQLPPVAPHSVPARVRTVDRRTGAATRTARRGTDRPRRDRQTKPLAPPAKLQESPLLTKLVEAGDLPALADRLPDHPYVIPHRWMTAGRYGGSLHLVTAASDDGSIKEYMYGHSLLRWLNDGLTSVPDWPRAGRATRTPRSGRSTSGPV